MAFTYRPTTKVTQRMVEFTNAAPNHLVGKRIPIITAITKEDNEEEILFDSKYDMVTFKVVNKTDPSYNKVYLPTFNDLIAEGVMKEWTPYRECTLNVSNVPLMWLDGKVDREPNYIAIRAYFQANGFEISISQLDYVWKCWRDGFKSGYRGQTCHLFAPCGDLNPFQLTATSLNPLCKDWQKTYYA